MTTQRIPLRMSVDPKDPGYENLRPYARVRINGVESHKCKTADEGLGLAICVATFANGRLRTRGPIDHPEIVLETISGEVVISRQCEQCGDEIFEDEAHLCKV